MRKRNTLEERIEFRMLRRAQNNIPACVLLDSYIRAELNRLAKQVRKLRKEVERPVGAIDAGYKTALTDVLELIREAKR